MTISWGNARDGCVATLATLHAGIEPIFLAQLAEKGTLSLASFGWVTGAGQLGFSAGALLCCRAPIASRRSAAFVAAMIGIAASLSLAIARDLSSVLLLRLLLGLAMGLLFDRAAAAAAKERPHRTIGLIMLGQQLLSTIVMASLSLVSARWGAPTAISMLAMAPLTIAFLTFFGRENASAETYRLPEQEHREGIPPPPFVLLAAVLLIAVTMMIWSYIGALGATLHIDGGVADMAIAAASLASAPAALLASFGAPRREAWITALVCGGGMLSPLLLPATSGLTAYGGTMVLFNAGSTFATIRFSGWAIAMCTGIEQRRNVLFAQTLATAAGAPLGAMAISWNGLPALAALCSLCIAASVALVFARSDIVRPATRLSFPSTKAAIPSQRAWRVRLRPR